MGFSEAEMEVARPEIFTMSVRDSWKTSAPGSLQAWHHKKVINS